MDDEDFRRYLNENEQAFRIWGNHIVKEVVAKLKKQLGYEPIPLFIKISPEPRLKSIESALGKISRKKYDDPVRQMTDLVGVRFVVLLSQNIEVISNIIQAEEAWNVINSKDFQDEIDRNPKLFDYQSQHFEVRLKDADTIEDILVSKDICCEVQIRTLLQHAYAEMVHDSIYKPVGPVPPKAERQVAKSMALMETTDDLFCSTMQILEETNALRNNIYQGLEDLYREKISNDLLRSDQKTNFAILDEFREFLKDDLQSQISELLNTKLYIYHKIRERSSNSHFFAQPVSLFVYWLILSNEAEDMVSKRWPLPGSHHDLEIIFSDLDRHTTYKYS